ncbi:MAG: hypothetical protein DCC75_13475 [Proteobacteria bacterium]|nr:MAG: hypothetical protein DCC75_13475 [Pseudomonadota bacterium]
MAAPIVNHPIIGLVAEPDINRRGRLKTAAQAIPSFKRIDQVSTLNEAISRISSDKNIDVLFLSSDYPEAEIGSFIAHTKEHFPNSDYAFVVILKQVDDQSALARIMLLGVHGFLCEPYSVDRLLEHRASQEALCRDLFGTQEIR